jgi:hypothetical protein
VFGFEVRLRVEREGGRIEHSELVYGDGLVMVGEASGKASRTVPLPSASPRAQGGANTQTLCVFVDDVDGHSVRWRIRPDWRLRREQPAEAESPPDGEGAMSRAAAPAGDQVRVSVSVAVPPAAAFEIFTQEIDRWWRRGPRFRRGSRRCGCASTGRG